MSAHNIGFFLCRNKKLSVFFVEKSALSESMMR